MQIKEDQPDRAAFDKATLPGAPKPSDLCCESQKITALAELVARGQAKRFNTTLGGVPGDGPNCVLSELYIGQLEDIPLQALCRHIEAAGLEVANCSHPDVPGGQVIVITPADRTPASRHTIYRPAVACIFQREIYDLDTLKPLYEKLVKAYGQSIKKVLAAPVEQIAAIDDEKRTIHRAAVLMGIFLDILPPITQYRMVLECGTLAQLGYPNIASVSAGAGVMDIVLPPFDFMQEFPLFGQLKEYGRERLASMESANLKLQQATNGRLRISHKMVRTGHNEWSRDHYLPILTLNDADLPMVLKLIKDELKVLCG